MRAVCFNQHVIELDLSGEMVSVGSLVDSDLRIFVNGHARSFKLSLAHEILVLLDQPLRALDQVFLRIRQRSSKFDSGVIRVHLALDTNTSHPLSGASINPVSLNSSLRGWLSSNDVLDASELTLQASNISPQYTRMSLTAKSSALTKVVLDSVHPGKVGEVIQVSVEVRSPGALKLSISQKNVFGKTFTQSAEYNDIIDWSLKTLSFMLPASGEVTVSLEAVPSTLSGYLDLRNAVVSSDWRGTLLQDPLATPLTWILSGDVFTGSDLGVVPSWSGSLGDTNLVLLTQNSVTLGGVS